MEVNSKWGKPVMDPGDVHCEIYNPSTEEIIFERMEGQGLRRSKMGLNPGDDKIVCKPDNFCYLPHQFYIARSASGGPVDAIVNYGDSMFKANKKPDIVSK